MNKAELIDALAEETRFSKKDMARILDTMKKIFVRQLTKGNKIQWTGLGTLKVVRRAPRQGINPITRAPLKLAASATARFSSGKYLKEQLRMALVK